jgi:hypothetical protein
LKHPSICVAKIDIDIAGNESTIAARTGFLTRSQDRGQNDDRNPDRDGGAFPLLECATLATR